MAKYDSVVCIFMRKLLVGTFHFIELSYMFMSFYILKILCCCQRTLLAIKHREQRFQRHDPAGACFTASVDTTLVLTDSRKTLRTQAGKVMYADVRCTYLEHVGSKGNLKSDITLADQILSKFKLCSVK